MPKKLGLKTKNTSIPVLTYSEKLMLVEDLESTSHCIVKWAHQGNSPKLFLGASIGPILGVIKPYYVSFDKLGEPNQIIIQNEGMLNKQDSIIGSVVWTKGLSELSYTPGIHFDLNFLVQWSNYNRAHKWQNGIRINYFPEGLNILLRANNSSFISIYTQYGFNRTK